MNIEVEIKSFITKQDYGRLNSFFLKNARLIHEDSQETCYFSGPKDIRSQKSKNSAKLIFKTGRVHDEQRGEIEVRVNKDDYNNLQLIAQELGLEPEIIWFRNRKLFKWQSIDVSLDYTKGYGYIIEMEKLSDHDHKDKDLKLLKSKLAELKIQLTRRDEFEKAFAHYKANWRELTK